MITLDNFKNGEYPRLILGIQRLIEKGQEYDGYLGRTIYTRATLAPRRRSSRRVLPEQIRREMCYARGEQVAHIRRYFSSSLTLVNLLTLSTYPSIVIPCFLHLGPGDGIWTSSPRSLTAVSPPTPRTSSGSGPATSSPGPLARPMEARCHR